ncbi:MAG: hypothetical protein WBB83_05850 [Candidatus Microthrix parvicella]
METGVLRLHLDHAGSRYIDDPGGVRYKHDAIDSSDAGAASDGKRIAA